MLRYTNNDTNGIFLDIVRTSWDMRYRDIHSSSMRVNPVPTDIYWKIVGNRGKYGLKHKDKKKNRWQEIDLKFYLQ